MKVISRNQINERGGMQELTIEEMKNVNGGGCYYDLLGCVKDGKLCCIFYYCNGSYTGHMCGDVEWYMQW